MGARDSAFFALGLRPGAGRAEVDRAYRKLIKIHHPDRVGGDGSRAAEINRAYTMLRRDAPAPQENRRGAQDTPRARRMPVPPRPKQRPSPRPRGARLALALTIAAVTVGALAANGNLDGLLRSRQQMAIRWPIVETGVSAASPVLTNFDEPLNKRVIQNAISDAIGFHSANDVAGAVSYSRSCHVKLRKQPNLAWFDACSAFDEAAATLSRDADLTESGPFSDSEVMVREMAAARTVSDDLMGADSRLHQIRLAVEMELLPKLDSPAPAKVQSAAVAAGAEVAAPSGF